MHRVRRNSTNRVSEDHMCRNSTNRVSEDPVRRNSGSGVLKDPVRSDTPPCLSGNEVSGPPGVQKLH